MENLMEQIKQAAFEDELQKIAGKKKKHPVSEAQRRWAFAAEEKGELPEGKAMKWAKRAKGKDLPKHANLNESDIVINHQSAFIEELDKIAKKNENKKGFNRFTGQLAGMYRQKFNKDPKHTVHGRFTRRLGK